MLLRAAKSKHTDTPVRPVPGERGEMKIPPLICTRCTIVRGGCSVQGIPVYARGKPHLHTAVPSAPIRGYLSWHCSISYKQRHALLAQQ